MAHSGTLFLDAERVDAAKRWHLYLAVLLVAGVVYLGCILSPPSLMDDVDAVQAQIARNMLQSGDWVTARLDGVAYLEKSPLKYWMIAVSFIVFGPHDWAARIPLALGTVFLCWLVARFGMWAFGARAGCGRGSSWRRASGCFSYPDSDSGRDSDGDDHTGTVVDAAGDGGGRRRWAMLMWASMATGLLLKGLMRCLFPVAAGLLYLAITRTSWKRLRPFWGILVLLLIAAPWHVIATLRNPPYFDLTMHSESGSYRGFFWFYFINEHVLRFLNLRYPRDYNTVPRVNFWLFHLLWFFPWSLYFPAALNLVKYRGTDRASRSRLLALCWAGFILVFFTFSTTQEYYSMPPIRRWRCCSGARWRPRGVGYVEGRRRSRSLQDAWQRAHRHPAPGP